MSNIFLLGHPSAHDSLLGRNSFSASMEEFRIYFVFANPQLVACQPDQLIMETRAFAICTNTLPCAEHQDSKLISKLILVLVIYDLK